MSGNVTIHIEKAFCNKPAEVKDSKAGKPIANFTLMTSTDKKNAEGKYDRGPTTFWNCVAFGSQAIKAGELLTGKVGGVDVVGVWVSEEYQEKVYNKVLIFEQGGTLALHDGQTANGTAKANGFAPEPVVVEASDDADIPF
jgi:single-stranded DNA-binding protein